MRGPWRTRPVRTGRRRHGVIDLRRRQVEAKRPALWGIPVALRIGTVAFRRGRGGYLRGTATKHIQGDMMSDSGKAQEAKGRAKEAVGAVTGNDEQKKEGRQDQAEGKVRQAGEKVRDAIDDIADAAKK